MKKVLFILFIACLSFQASAQSLPNVDSVRLSTKEDYRTADAVAIAAAKYLLSTPIDKHNTDRLKAIQFIMKWMEGTPDYSFSITGNPVNAFVNDLDLMSVYMACLTSYAISNKSVKDNDMITLNATKTFINYIDNRSNNAGMNGKLKKLSAANKNGELAAYLKQ